MIDQFYVAVFSLVGMLFLLGVGVPVAVAMISTSFVGLWLSAGLHFSLTNFETLPYSAASSFNFAAIPTFVAMGIIFGKSGLANSLFKAADVWMANVRGGLYMAVVIASAAFGAINGSTIVGSALFTKIALPEMIRLGYSRSASAGCIVGAGTFSAMIPPSITMVLYGLLTNESIGRILIAGIFPGILTAAIYLLGIFVMVRIRPDWAPKTSGRSFSATEKLDSLKTLAPVAIVFAIIVGGIYSGVVAPASAGAIGAFFALVIAMLMKKIKFNDFSDSMRETASTTAVLFFIVIGGLAFSRLLLVTGTVDELIDLIHSSSVEPWMVMLIIIIFYLILGCVMDSISMMVMTVPIVHPIVVGLGYDPIWFAIIMVKLIELSVITPPVGLNLYAVQSSSNGLVSTSEVFRGVGPFIAMELVVLVLLFLSPELVTFLPDMMIK